MSVQQVSDSRAWAQFLQASQAARSRNVALGSAALQQPAPAVRTASAQPASRPLAQPRAAEVTQPMGYRAAVRPENHKQTIGTLFDSYA
jgi:hypothetical protein